MSSDSDRPDRSDRSDRSNRSDRPDTEDRDVGPTETETGTTDRTAVRDALEAALEDAAIDATNESATDDSSEAGSTEGEPAPWTGAGGSGPDRSVLNRAAIRRFAAGVLEAHGGAVDRETNARWSVRLPEALAAELGTEHATLVFDSDAVGGSDDPNGPDGRAVGSEAILVAPGTRAFNALCALAGRSIPSVPESESPSSAASTSTASAGSESTPDGDVSDSASVDADDRAGRDGAVAGGAASGVGRVHLGSDLLQLHVPPILDAGELETTIEEFAPRGEERALAFQFRAQFLSVRSYQREETHTVAVDPATRSVLPALAARLDAHLLCALDRNAAGHSDERKGRNQDSTGSREPEKALDPETIRSAYSAAKRGVSGAVEPTAEALREREEAAIEERIEEIDEYYDRRRAELDEQVETKRAAISEYAEKYDRAQGDETRLRYLQEQREAEDELAAVTERVEERTEALRSERDERIAEAIERHRIDVEVDLASVTDVTYERGTLALSVGNGETTARVSLSYVPATEEHYGLECGSCGTDLLAEDRSAGNRSADGSGLAIATAGRPRLCVGGHLVCEDCAVSCRTCGEVRCSSCLGTPERARSTGEERGRTRAGTTDPGEATSAGSVGSADEFFGNCWLCREAVCVDCVDSCAICEEPVCADHREQCETCGAMACLACGEPCAAGGEFHCDSHLTALAGPGETDEEKTSSESKSNADGGSGELYCGAHVESCSECGDRRSVDAIEVCGACGEALCEAHRQACAVCGEFRCGEHAIACEHCVDERAGNGPETEDPATETVGTFCSEHAEACRGGGEVVCEAHSQPGVIVDGPVCTAHRAPCELCGVSYAEAGFEESRCPACRNLDTETPAEPPVAAIAEEFATVRIGTTPTHAVIQGKRRLRRDEIIVVDRQTGEELRRSKADFFSKLSGDP